MKIIHTITYTVRGLEQSTQITRSRKLSLIGCERILKRSNQDAIVTRVETAIATP